jgi:integrase
MSRPRKARSLPGVRLKTYTRKDGTVSQYWQYAVYMPDQNGRLRREWHNAPSQRAAEEARAERKVEVKHGEAVNRSKLTLGVWLAEWLPRHAEKRRMRPTSRATAEIIINTRINPHLGAIPLQQLSERHIEDFIYQLQTRGGAKGKPLAPRSVKNTLVILREALQQARRERRIPRNPCTDIEPPTIDAKQEPQWTAAQAKQFLALLDGERYRALFILTAATGLRRGELLGLKWDALDLDAGILDVRTTLVEAAGRLILQDVTKTPSGARVIRLPTPVVAMLAEHRQQLLTKRLAAGPAWQEQGLVFSTPQGKPLNPRNVYRRLRQLAERAGIPYVALHGFRRTASSIAHNGTKDMLAVAQMLGHKHPDVTARHYTQAAEDAAERTKEALEQALFGT